MPTAHVFFCKPINPDTATGLINACRFLTGEKDPDEKAMWDTLSLVISSGGGDVTSSIAMFNELKGLPIKLTTHNAGAIDSAAILPFIAGSRRIACANSAFFFHQLQWTFASKDNVSTGVISDATKYLDRYEGLMADAVASRTELDKKMVLKLMRDGTSVGPEQAKEWGLIHEIGELATPHGARHWQV